MSMVTVANPVTSKKEKVVTMPDDDSAKTPPASDYSRRDMFKSAGAVAAGLAASGLASAQAAGQQPADPAIPQNSDGGGLVGGASSPPYFHGAVAQDHDPKIVHDSEYYIIEAQHGERWAAEDRDLDAKLATLRQKYGGRPNIIHIMFDDTPVGEVGVPFIQKQRGWETPNINRLAAEGINFTRMYSEPSCPPSRAAVMTGRQPVRNGMYNVGFPYE